jgi:SSS family solute:Na+ symporter
VARGGTATVAFTLWTLGWLPIPFAVPFDLYYTAIFGNLVMFGVGYAASLALPRRGAVDRGLRI